MEKTNAVYCLLVSLFYLTAIVYAQTACIPDFEYQHKVLESIVKFEYRLTEKDEQISSLSLRLEDALSSLTKLNSTVKAQRSQENSGGSTYIRWGRRTCPDGDSVKIYDGWVGGSWYSHSGSGGNYLCLPKDPVWGTYNDGDRNVAFIYGTEYETGGKNNDLEVPCSVCWTPRANTMMLPARKECYPGWKLEYNGYLAAEHYSHYRKDYICLDEHSEATENSKGSNENGALIYQVEARCGALPCDKYPSGRELTCAVCSYSPNSGQQQFHP